MSKRRKRLIKRNFNQLHALAGLWRHPISHPTARSYEEVPSRFTGLAFRPTAITHFGSSSVLCTGGKGKYPYFRLTANSLVVLTTNDKHASLASARLAFDIQYTLKRDSRRRRKLPRFRGLFARTKHHLLGVLGLALNRLCKDFSLHLVLRLIAVRRWLSRGRLVRACALLSTLAFDRRCSRRSR